jgi:hypothetical protein
VTRDLSEVQRAQILHDNVAALYGLV